MYGYIYKTTNKITGQIYIGQHKRNFEDGIDTKYYGSGKYITAVLQRYGLSNFQVELLEWCETYALANEKEKYWIEKLNSLYTQGNYNICKGGKGGAPVGIENPFAQGNYKYESLFGETNPFYGKKHTEQTKIKISKAKKGTPPPNKGKKYTEEEKQKMYYNKIFHMNCKMCGCEVVSKASGTKYCDVCLIKKQIEEHEAAIIKMSKNNPNNIKDVYINKRKQKIKELESQLYK